MIEEIIKPETELEKIIISDPEFIEGALWGKPRNGHPEGQVIYHIGHILKNIENIRATSFLNGSPMITLLDRERLRLIAIIHDSFKYKVNRDLPKRGENHHGMIARRFAEKYITDLEVLEIIELHDEAYNAWCKGWHKRQHEKAGLRAKQLIERLGSSIDLYMQFYQCDNETGDKTSQNYTWFEKIVSIHGTPQEFLESKTHRHYFSHETIQEEGEYVDVNDVIEYAKRYHLYELSKLNNNGNA